MPDNYQKSVRKLKRAYRLLRGLSLLLATIGLAILLASLYLGIRGFNTQLVATSDRMDVNNSLYLYAVYYLLGAIYLFLMSLPVMVFARWVWAQAAHVPDQ